MMGVYAEFERGMTQELVRAAMAHAKAKGTKSGNTIVHSSVSAAIKDRIRELRAKGLGILKITRQACCGVSIAQSVLAVS